MHYDQYPYCKKAADYSPPLRTRANLHVVAGPVQDLLDKLTMSPSGDAIIRRLPFCGRREASLFVEEPDLLQLEYTVGTAIKGSCVIQWSIQHTVTWLETREKRRSASRRVRLSSSNQPLDERRPFAGGLQTALDQLSNGTGRSSELLLKNNLRKQVRQDSTR